MTEVSISPEVGFLKSEADQCLFVKKGKHEPVVLLLRVDDSCIFEVSNDVEETMNTVRKKFTIKTGGGLKEF